MVTNYRSTEMAKKLKRDQNVAKDQEQAFQNHWCVDTTLGAEVLDCILLDIFSEGKITRDDYRNLTAKQGEDHE
jgi:hypothetical protein